MLGTEGERGVRGEGSGARGGRRLAARRARLLTVLVLDVVLPAQLFCGRASSVETPEMCRERSKQHGPGESSAEVLPPGADSPVKGTSFSGDVRLCADD